MKYALAIVLFLIVLPLAIIGAIFYMRRRPQKALQSQLGNAPIYQNVPGTTAALGGTAVATAATVVDTAKSLRALYKDLVPDDADYIPEPSIPVSQSYYDWGSGTAGTEDNTYPIFTLTPALA